MTNHCRHNWRDLYQQPNKESGFIQIYDAQKLGLFKHCQVCGAIGKFNERGAVLLLTQPKWDKHVLQAARWSGNLNTFAAAVQEQGACHD